MNNKKLLGNLFLTLSIFISGCGSQTVSTQDQSLSELNISVEETNSTLLQIDTASNINNNFAFEMNHYVENKQNNNFLSSYSLFSMLNILLSGSQGNTRQEMINAGNIKVDQQNWENAYNALNRQIITFLDHNNSGFKFSFGNSFWLQEGTSVSQDYITKLQTNYGINIKTVNFKSNPQQSRDTINRWSSNMTDGHIDTILAQDTIDQTSEMVLVNAMYLKALWKKAFYKNETNAHPFLLEDGSTIDVPLMHQVNQFRYSEKDGVETLCMRYQNSEFGLISFLPPKGEFETFEASLNNNTLDDYTSGFSWETIDLYYPKLTISSQPMLLKDLLIDKGMVEAFSDDANFTGIDKDFDLKLSQIAQKIYFTIDEEGTEEASSSISIGGVYAQEGKLLKFDRPFLFMICHIPTRTIIFMGRVVNPLEKVE
ncbi:MAG: serpin family protein [Epsilonproteobacteria bacterium]|nr:serpin family protein [Campylobacterota bacterium]